MIDALGDLGDFVGGMGVIATLIYLAFQIRGHTQALQSNSIQALQDSANGMNMSISDHSELAEILVKAERGTECLSPVERYRFEAFAARLFETHETAFNLRSRNHIDAEIWAGWERGFRSELTPAYLAFWDQQKEAYYPAFQDFVENSRAASQQGVGPERE